MVVIENISGKIVLDTRKEKTIEIVIKTNLGNFSSSSPTGKSTGKYEARSYQKEIEEEIKVVNSLKIEEEINDFSDLEKIENILKKKIGANTIFALESAILKSLAKKNKKEVWEIIGENKSLPRLVGNCIGGGKHSTGNKKPDFQEFLIIPKINSPSKAWELNKLIKNQAEVLLMKNDKNFKSLKNDEDAWQTSLTDKEILEILKELKSKFEFDIGLDIASSGFYSRGKYVYNNPPIKRNSLEQIKYLKNMINNFSIFYIEDPFNENDFDSFSELNKEFRNILIVGDDLTTTNLKRLEKAIEKNSISGIIVKPNQIGSLIEVSKVCKLAKENNIKIIFSHRSGETSEDIIADLAFGFGADFIKCGITGIGREEKIKRLIEIEKSLAKKSFKN